MYYSTDVSPRRAQFGIIGDITGGDLVAFPIRGLPEDVGEKLDQIAAQRGLSRNAYVIELLTAHVREARPEAAADRFAAAASLAADLGDDDLMRAAWS